MDPVVSISPRRVEVAPGGEATLTVLVRNPDSIVVEYDITVLGEPARWTETRPSSVSLLPAEASQDAAEQRVAVVVRPPRPPAAPAGEIPLGVRCVSREDPDRCTVEEAVVVVSTVQGLEADLRPVGRRGRRAGHLGLLLRNTGTVPLTVTVRAADDAERLRFAVAPVPVEVPPGASRTVYVAVRPCALLWVGRPVQHAFTVTYQVAGSDGADTRAATHEQRPVLPRWLLLLLMLLVVVLVGGVVWWVLTAPEPTAAPVRGGPPPPVSGVAAVSETPGVSLVTWTPSPYSVSGYRVRTVTEGDGTVLDRRVVEEAEQGAYEWTDQAGGRTCFEVVALGYDQNSGASSEPACVEVLTPEPEPSEPEPTSSQQAPDPGASDDGGGAAGEETAGGGEPTTPTTPTTPTVPLPGGAGGPDGPAQQPLADWFVVYQATQLADTVGRGELPQLLVDLQQSGVDAQLLEGADFERISDDSVYVLTDGFDNREAALAHCNSFRSLAPLCFVGPRPAGQ